MARSDDRAHRQIHNDNDDDEGPPRRDRSRKSGSSHHSSSSPNRKKKRKIAKSHHRRHHRSHHQHHHAAAAADEEPPPAELAAATLLEHFRQILQGEGQGQSKRDVQKARNALEATAGNMQMAAQLYWDDYFASHAAAAANQDVDQKPAARKRGDTDSGESDGSDDEDGDEYLKPHRKLRRSLDRDFQAADDAKRKAHEDDDDNEDEDGDDEDNNDILDNDRDNQRQMLMDAIAGQQDRILAELAGESASVSDDEAVAGGVWRIVDDAVGNVGGGIEKKETKAKKHRNQSRPPNDFGRRIREAAAAVANEVLPQFKESPQGGKRRNKVEKEDDGEEEDYISDSDWLEEEAAVVGSPFEPLWGEGDREATSTSAVNEGNVVANDENDEFLVDSGVPYTWLNASFSLASCGGGLGIKPPKVEDMEFYEWRQQQNSRSGVPPPYHCRAITAILSMVTAIIYTGASIQGNEVNCTSGRKPFMELTEQERKREFESRLADALSSLIFIAAKASSARKRRAFNKARKEIGTTEVRIKKMQRRLRLIPTCSWEEQPINVPPRAPGSCTYRRIDVATSLTNVKDIRTYVLSNMRAFTARGGVALLLETISRIHGKGVISRMMERARKGANNACTTQKHLLCCSCEDRQTKMYEDNPLPRSVRNDPSKLLDTSPPGHECVTVELLSLLLTGHVHSSWKGWSTEDFGFGVLIGNAEVDWRFSRPEKPVWVLQGERCYSVLWIEEDKENVSKTISKLDKPGTSLTLGHWNCWYGERNKSEMRLITSSGEWKRPKVAGKFDGSAWQERCDLKPPKGTVDLLIDRRCEKKLNLQSVHEHEANKTKEQECRITKEELELTKAHPEDQRFYPGKHRMWRFDMGEGDKADGDCQTAGDVKMRGEQWVPYHRLTARQKLLVETKLGPKINSILWSRWPGARIDNFVPVGEPYPIV